MNFTFIKFRFILVDIGDSGCHSGGGVLSNSDFGQALVNDSLFIPDSCPLTGTMQPKLPYVIVTDETFSLMMNMVRPYPGKKLPGLSNIIYLNMLFTSGYFINAEDQAIHNYRLSRAHRVIKNSFGILAARRATIHAAVLPCNTHYWFDLYQVGGASSGGSSFQNPVEWEGTLR